MSTENQMFVADVLVRRDRGNKGSNKSEAINLVQDLLPHPSRIQAGQYFTTTIIPKHHTVLKSRTVKAQATTTKRSAITVEQQFRWMETYQKALSVLRSKNTGTCRQTGKMFGKLIQHFSLVETRPAFRLAQMGTYASSAVQVGSLLTIESSS